MLQAVFFFFWRERSAVDICSSKLEYDDISPGLLRSTQRDIQKTGRGKIITVRKHKILSGGSIDAGIAGSGKAQMGIVYHSDAGI